MPKRKAATFSEEDRDFCRRSLQILRDRALALSLEQQVDYHSALRTVCQLPVLDRSDMAPVVDLTEQEAEVTVVDSDPE